MPWINWPYHLIHLSPNPSLWDPEQTNQISFKKSSMLVIILTWNNQMTSQDCWFFFKFKLKMSQCDLLPLISYHSQSSQLIEAVSMSIQSQRWKKGIIDVNASSFILISKMFYAFRSSKYLKLEEQCSWDNRSSTGKFVTERRHFISVTSVAYTLSIRKCLLSSEKRPEI